MSGQRITIEALPETLRARADELMGDISTEFKSRGFRAANEMRNAEQLVLRGQRSGRMYNVPGTGRLTYKKGKRIVIGREADNYGRKGRKKYGREAGTATITYRKYQASAPGEPPAVRTGAYRNSFSRRTYAEGSPDDVVKVHALIESRITIPNGSNLGNLLEGGTGRMAPRPHREKIIEKAKPNIQRIYTRKYL